MKFTLSWLKDHLDTDESVEKLADKLTMIGLEVESLEDKAKALAPFTIATHLKDMSVEWYEDGFLLSEVVLGQGFLDLQRMISLIRRARPATRFSLEMITRDPLQVPCLTEKFWITFPERNGVFLARTMQLVERYKSAKPLPRISLLSPEAQLRTEQENVRASMQYGRLMLRS